MRFILFVFFSFLFFSCELISESNSIKGIALGTQFNIKHDARLDNSTLKMDIDSILKKINKSMSTYHSDSDISKINSGQEVQVDSFFQEVYYKASEVWKSTNGAFDPTVGALVNAYGFGPDQKFSYELSDIQLDSLLNITGWNKIYLNDKGVLTKSNKNITLDFNALAKGYTVDIISKHLESIGSKNYLVEIGGEIIAKGLSPRSNKPWEIGIDYPKSKLSERKNYTTYFLSNRAMATSGNYRHFRIDKKTGKKYVHTIDPRTGNPIQSEIISTSVTAIDCITADAWATSLMVLSLNEGKKMIENDSDLEALWIVSNENGLESIYSSGWKK
ncbi:MAG: FAD:protein FMN transferase [Flavobacteriaceae bacterium]|nr:FAD:protein FMN transferase [Flavobacteriaceae bacterium]